MYIGNTPFQGLVGGGNILDASIEGVDLSTSAIAARLGYTPVDPGAAVFSANPTISSGVANGVAYLNGSKVVTSGSALTFDGTNFTTPRVLFGGSTLPAAGTPSIALRTSDNTIYHQSGSANTIVMLDSAQNTMQSIGATVQIWNISNSEQMRLTSGGLTVSPSSGAGYLSLGSNAGRAQYQYINFGGGVGGTDYGWQIGRSASNGITPDGFYIYDIKSNTNRVAIDLNGNFGIGTNTPAYKLEVNGTSRLGGSSYLDWFMSGYIPHTGVIGHGGTIGGAQTISKLKWGSYGRIQHTSFTNTPFISFNAELYESDYAGSGSAQGDRNYFRPDHAPGAFGIISSANGGVAFNTGYWNNATSINIGVFGDHNSYTGGILPTKNWEIKFKLGIGTATPNAKLHIGSETETNITNQALFVQGSKAGYAGFNGLPTGQLFIYDDTASTAGSGGAIGFGANTGSSQRTWIASINSERDSATNDATNYAGSLAFYTRPAQSPPEERLRITSSGSLIFANTNTAGIIRRKTVNGSNGLRIQGNAADTIDDTNAGAYILIGGGIIGDTYEGNIDITAYGGIVDSNRNQIRFSNRSGTNTTQERMRIDHNGRVLIGSTAISSNNTNGTLAWINGGLIVAERKFATNSASFYSTTSGATRNITISGMNNTGEYYAKVILVGLCGYSGSGYFTRIIEFTGYGAEGRVTVISNTITTNDLSPTAVVTATTSTVNIAVTFPASYRCVAYLESAQGTAMYISAISGTNA